MDNLAINRKLADIIGLRVTEDTDGDRPIWLIDGKVEWNPVEKIEQLWPLVKRYRVETMNYGDGCVHDCGDWEARCTDSRGKQVGAAVDEDSLERAIARAIIAAHNPCREGR